MRLIVFCAVVGWFTASTSCSALAGEFSVEPSDAGAVVKVDGRFFAEYVKLSGHQPIVWPIHGPDGSAMTRAYPMTDPQENEMNDHPHHRSLWFTHGIVNDKDFWIEPSNRGNRPKNFIRHREFAELDAKGDTARIVTVNDWMSDEVKVCDDRRTLVFGASDDRRWIDFTVVVSATDGDVTFGDTKEGSFGLRVAGTMKVDADMGGRFVNSHGQVDGGAWGQPAPWINYTGPVDGKPAGIAVFSHPSNFRPECRWHTREYGLLAANPFGLKDFPRGVPSQGATTVADGDALNLRYLVLFHRGDLTNEQLQSQFESFSSSNGGE